MAVAFRSISSSTYGAATASVTCAAPAGLANGDTMLAMVFQYSGISTPPGVPTAPAGWTQVGIDQTPVHATSMRGSLWKKVAASESGSYTWSWSFNTVTAQVIIAAYSGSSGVVNVSDSVVGFPANTTRTFGGVTTTAANCMLVGMGWDYGNNTNNELPPTGMTERLDNVLSYACDVLQPAAGASGTKTNTCNSNSGDPRGGFLVALEVAAAAYSLAAAAGSYAFTGTAATLTQAMPNKTIAATPGSYAFTGTDATLTKGGGTSSAPLFRAASNTTYTSRGGLTSVAKPTGTANGDIMVAGLFAYQNTPSPTVDLLIAPPAGWTQVDFIQSDPIGGDNWKLYAFWKRASSEGATYDFIHSGLNTTATTQGVIVAYSGALATGSPVDAWSKTSGFGTAATYASVTTTAPNDMMVLLGHNWTASQTLSPPTGMTERYDHITYAADETIAASGATGTRSHTVNAASDPWGGFLIALKGGVSTTTYSLNADSGTYSFTGTAATLRLSGNKLAAATGSYALTGTPATITRIAGGLPVFRAGSSTTYTSRTTVTTVAKPTGTADGDVMVATFLGAAASAANIAITVPAGWTQIGTTTTVTQPGGSFFGKLWVLWKRASSEGTTYDFLHANTLSTQVSISSYSGCLAFGSPIDVFSQASGNSGSTATATGVTTTTANTKLIYTGHNWDGTALDPPTGMTELFDSVVYSADESRVVAGATGARTQTLDSDNPWQAYLVALKGGSAFTSYGVTAVSGIYTIVGTTVTTGRALIVAAGSYTIAGVPVTLRGRGRNLDAAAGSYVLTGTAATLRAGHNIDADPGSYTLNGVPVALVGSIPAPAPSGMSVWTGSAWVSKPVKVWTGSAWVAKPVKIWNGSAWT